MGVFGWVAVAVVVILGLATVILLIAVMTVAGQSTSTAQVWRYQCDSAIGPDPSATETVAPEAATETMAPSDMPTTNPYAELTFGPNDAASPWELACASAMPSAAYQLPPLQTVASGAAVDCVRQVAAALLGRQSAGSAGLAQDVIYQVSQANSTGRCVFPSAPAGAGPTSDSVGIGAAPVAVPVAGACPRGTATSGVIVLPNTLAAQAVCGQRVATSAVSPGDLVFWSYSNYAPTSAGVAVSAGQIVTVDPVTGRVVTEAMPTGSGVRVKRVLVGIP